MSEPVGGAPPALLDLEVDDRDDEGTFGPRGTEEWMAFFRDSEGNLLGLVERREGSAP